jgi:hypothetical protein
MDTDCAKAENAIQQILAKIKRDALGCGDVEALSPEDRSALEEASATLLTAMWSSSEEDTMMMEASLDQADIGLGGVNWHWKMATWRKR